MWAEFIQWWKETRNKRVEEIWDREEVWNAIHELSDIRAGYNCFDDKENGKYHTCSLAIKALREVIKE